MSSLYYSIILFLNPKQTNIDNSLSDVDNSLSTYILAWPCISLQSNSSRGPIDIFLKQLRENSILTTHIPHITHFISNHNLFYHPDKVWRRDVLKHITYHVGNYGDLKSKDSNNTTMMRITYDNYPCGISQQVDLVHNFSKYVPMSLT